MKNENTPETLTLSMVFSPCLQVVAEGDIVARKDMPTFMDADLLRHIERCSAEFAIGCGMHGNAATIIFRRCNYGIFISHQDIVLHCVKQVRYAARMRGDKALLKQLDFVLDATRFKYALIDQLMKIGNPVSAVFFRVVQ